MISELVAGSAWMKPPVDGPAEARDRRRGLRRGAAPGGRRRAGDAVGDGLRRAAAAAAAAGAERRAQHRRQLHRVGVLQVHDPDVAHAAVAPAVGWSSLSTSERIDAMRAGLAARTSSELLRASTRIDAAPPPRPAHPGAPALPPRVGQALHQRRDVGGHRVLAAGSPRRRRRPACPSPR